MLSQKAHRLQEELREMNELKANSSLISFVAEGSYPTRYEVEFSCKGLCRMGNIIIPRTEHAFDMILDDDFPFVAPQIIWKTLIFHPNFLMPEVCLGDHWYPGMSLAEVCIALCEMVQYKEFNVYDPLDPQAAEWVKQRIAEDRSDFPVDTRPILDLDFEITVTDQTEKHDNG